MGRRRVTTAVPDHLRCRRSDGKKWRCPRQSLPNICFCLHHLLLSRNNVAKHKPPSEEVEDEWSEKLTDDLVRAAVRRRMTKARSTVAMTTERRLELPNGVMVITPPTRPYSSSANAGLPLKLDPDRRSFLERCFRSKNCDPQLVGSRKKLPIRRRRKDGKVTRKACHLCKKKASKLVPCCKCCMLYCIGCTQKADSEINALQVSRACSHPHAASITPGEIQWNEERTNFRNKVNKRHKHHMRKEFLSTHKHLKHEQLIGMGIDSNKKGGRFSGIWCKSAESDLDRPLSCLRGASITKAHRFCTTCSSKLCLSCFNKKRRRGSKEATTHSLGHSDRRKAYEHITKEKVGTEAETFSWCHPFMPSLRASKVSSQHKFKKTSRRTCFPSKALQDCVLAF